MDRSRRRKERWEFSTRLFGPASNLLLVGVTQLGHGSFVRAQDIGRDSLDLAVTLAFALRDRALLGEQVRAGDRAQHSSEAQGPDRVWHLDEMVIRIGGKRMWMWRAVDKEMAATLKLLRKLLKKQRFKSQGQAQRFVSTHDAIYNTFNIQRHLTSRNTMRHFRSAAFAEWDATSPAAE